MRSIIWVAGSGSFILGILIYNLRTHHIHSEGAVIGEEDAASSQSDRDEPRASPPTKGASTPLAKYVVALFGISHAAQLIAF